MKRAVEIDEATLGKVTGGSWISDAWDATCDWVDEHKGMVVRGACVVGGIALCATGIGAGAGLGIIAVESIGAAAVVSTGFGLLVGAGIDCAVMGDGEEGK